MAVAVAAIAVVGDGCTTLLYKGPTRPESEIAVVTSTATIVDRVDEVMVRDHASGSYARLELLPGPHRLAISLNEVTPGLFMTHIARSNPILVCLDLAAGHTYRTEPHVVGSRFFPRVVDLTTSMATSGCRSARPVPPPLPPPATVMPPPVPPASRPTDPPGLVRAADGAAAPNAAAPPTASPAAGGPGAAPSVEAPPPAPRSRATDTEEPLSTAGPTLRAVPAREHLPSDAQLAKRPPGSGLSLSFGAAFGGDDFVKATNSNGDEESLSSGSGVILGVGAMLTPLWVDDLIGFGLGVDGAIKYDHLSASNGSASITRFPLALTAQMLINISDSLHYFIVKGGASRDFGVSYSASGFATLDVKVSSTWGPTGAFGYFKRSNDVFGWDILAFFALTKHVIGAEQINANSFGVSWGVHWRP